MKRILACLLATAALVAGCTTPGQTPGDDTLEPTGDGNGTTGTGNTTRGNTTTGNNTTLAKPPVARMQVFEGGGALAFESNFVADNVTTPVHVKGGESITFLGSPSEAVDRTAKIEAWEWSFGDGATASGRSVNHSYSDLGGNFVVTLTVRDSNNLTDALTLALAAEPTREYVRPLNLTGNLQLGTLGVALQEGLDLNELPLEVLGTIDGLPVEVVGARFTLTPGAPLSDFDLVLLDPQGNVSASDTGVPLVGVGEPAPPEPGNPASIEVDTLATGPHTFQVILVLGADADYSLDGEVVYRVINPALHEADGHTH
jgi:hypothetical protein